MNLELDRRIHAINVVSDRTHIAYLVNKLN